MIRFNKCLSHCLFGTAALALFCAGTLSSTVSAQDNDVLARINNETITLEEFNRRYEQNSQLVPGATPSKEDVLKNIIYFELATQEARKKGIHQEQSLKDQFDILLYQEMVKRFVQPQIDALKVSESEVRNYYNRNPLLRTSHIILLSKPGMSSEEVAEMKTRAAEVLEKVKSGKKSFEEYAREYSEGPSAKTGGDVDWGARHKLLPEYYEAALKLSNKGDISDLVETPYGIHIIQLTGKRPFSEMDAAYRDFVVRTIRESKGQQVFDDYFGKLRADSKVFVNEKLLK